VAVAKAEPIRSVPVREAVVVLVADVVVVVAAALAVAGVAARKAALPKRAAAEKEAASRGAPKGTTIKVAEAIGRGAAVVSKVLESLTGSRKRRSS
jgi:hypothetical protein